MGAHGTAAVVNVCAIIGCCGFRASKRSAQRGAERNGARQGRGGGGRYCRAHNVGRDNGGRSEVSKDGTEVDRSDRGASRRDTQKK